MVFFFYYFLSHPHPMLFQEIGVWPNYIFSVMISENPCHLFFDMHHSSNTLDCFCLTVSLTIQYILGEAMSIAVHPIMEVEHKTKPPTKQRRVVVTGMGVETPLGDDPDIFYNNLLEGASGISVIEAFDCSQFPTVCFACSFFHFLKVSGFNFNLNWFLFEINFRELLERSNLSQLMAWLLPNFPSEWIGLCFTCWQLARRLWLMEELMKMSWKR